MSRTSNGDKLRIYSLYRQGYDGDCVETAPSMFNVVEYAKYKAYLGKKGMSKTVAIDKYLELAKKLDPEWFAQDAATLSSTSSSSSEKVEEGSPASDEVVDDLESRFMKALKRLKDMPKDILDATSNGDKLRIYSLYRQGYDGDCVETAPSMFNVVEYAKYKAYLGKKGMPKDDARKKYLALARKLDPTWSGWNSTVDESSSSSDAASEARHGELVQAYRAKHAKALSTRVRFFELGLALCGLSCAGGVTGFALSILPRESLKFLALTVVGLVGTVALVAKQVSAKGAIFLCSDEIKKHLFETSVLDVIVFLTTDSSYVELKRKIRQVAPLFIATSHEERAQVLRAMDEETRVQVVRPGLVDVLPSSAKRLMLPDSMAKLRAEEETPLLLEYEMHKALDDDVEKDESEDHAKSDERASVLSVLVRRRVAEIRAVLSEYSVYQDAEYASQALASSYAAMRGKFSKATTSAALSVVVLLALWRVYVGYFKR